MSDSTFRDNEPTAEQPAYSEQPTAEQPAYSEQPTAGQPVYSEQRAPEQPAYSQPAYVPSTAYPYYSAPAPAPAPRAGHSGWALVAAAILGGLIGGALVMGVLVLYDSTRSAANGTGGTLPARQTNVSATPVSLQSTNAVEAVAEKVTPSVVNIQVSSTTYNPFMGNRASQSQGSGVIIRQDGYILTNNHVVEGGESIKVGIGTEEVPAKVVGTDPSSDLAVIKVEKTGLSAADMGKSGDLRVGQEVIAIGSPFGLEKTVTSGIVSALNRTNFAENQQGFTAYLNLVQTDAAINPGNSGGALVNLAGQVVGINTLIESTSGSSAGIGFAIPIDYARTIADQLISTGRVVHPYMGISTVSVDEQVSQQYDLGVDRGALVQYVEPGSPAEKAGIKTGDVVVRIGTSDIKEYADVFAAVRGRTVGDKVPVELMRKGKKVTVEVTLASDARTQ